MVGDALCAFDPVYGQGMTVAAIEAVALGRCLQQEGPGLATRFHRAAAEIIDTPWTIAVGGVPDDDGQVPWRSRLVGAYLARLLDAGSDDPELAIAFLRVNHLVDRPSELFRPRTVWRVLRHRLAGAPGVGRGRVRGSSPAPPGRQQVSPSRGTLPSMR